MAERLMPVSVRLADAAGVNAGDRVLDIACGTGNATVAAAARGAHAVGVDFEPALLALARARAPEVDWLEGDAAALPVGDGEFDVVLSAFGVMYAPDHEAAAREIARVARPGARIALAAWTPGSLMPAMGGVLAPYLPPPPPGSGPPSRWGSEDELATILSAAGLSLTSASRETVPLEADADFLIATAGHVLAERERLEAEGRWEALRADLSELVTRGLPAEYLLALASPSPTL